MATKSKITTEDAITSFRGDENFLSNFYKSPITIDGILYSTVEHAFQAFKSHDVDVKKSLADVKSPMMVKRAGRKVKLREDWEDVKVELMHDCLSAKFSEGSPLCKQLLATGERPLIEGNKWHDNYWGSCFCQKHKDTEGKNVLGKQLMRVRDERRKSLKDAEGSKEKPHPS